MVARIHEFIVKYSIIDLVVVKDYVIFISLIIINLKKYCMKINLLNLLEEDQKKEVVQVIHEMLRVIKDQMIRCDFRFEITKLSVDYRGYQKFIELMAVASRQNHLFDGLNIWQTQSVGTDVDTWYRPRIAFLEQLLYDINISYGSWDGFEDEYHEYCLNFNLEG